MSKNAYYFSHDAGARNDEKLLIIRANFEYEGYGWFFAICELFRESSDYTLSHDIAMLKLCLGIDKAYFEKFMEKCFEIKLFEFCPENPKRFFSESFLKRMAQVNNRHKKLSEAGRLGGIARAALIKGSYGDALASLKQRKEKKRKESKIKEINTPLPPEGALSIFDEFLKSFNEITKRTYRGDSKTKRQLNARLTEGFTLEQLITATANCLKDPYHQANPNYLTPEFITRSDKLQKYINWTPPPPPSPQPEKPDRLDKFRKMIASGELKIDRSKHPNP